MENILKNNKIICDNRKILDLSGIDKLKSSQPTQVVCETNKTPLIIIGKNLHIKKLNLEEGVVQIEGEIDEIKYQAEKKNLFKRIFK